MQGIPQGCVRISGGILFYDIDIRRTIYEPKSFYTRYI